MKVIIDLQGAQGENRSSIYAEKSMRFTKELILHSHAHEVLITLSSSCKESCISIYEEFKELIPSENIKFLHTDDIYKSDSDLLKKRAILESIREAFFLSLSPDLVILTQGLEAYDSELITSFKVFDKKTPVVFLLQDDESLKDLLKASSKDEKIFKDQKISSLKKADLLLSFDLDVISKIHSMKELKDLMIHQESLDGKRIWGLFERHFPVNPKIKNDSSLLKKTGIFKAAKKKILVLKLDHMGDFILAIPALSKLKARFPHAEIDIMVGKWNEDLAKGTGFFHSVICFDFFSSVSGRKTEANSTQIEEALSKLPHYDIAIDLKTFHETRPVLAKVSANIKIGYESLNSTIDKTIDFKLKFERNIPFYKTSHNKCSISLQMIDIIDAIPQDVNDYIFLPTLCDPSIKKEEGHIAIFPRAGSEAREWKWGNYAELIQLLSNSSLVKNINIYLPPYFDTKDVEKIESDKVMIHNNLSSKQLLESLSTNVLCICNNSFAAHISSYLGIKCLGIFSGHETTEEWGPSFYDAYVLSKNVPCSPCHLASKEECIQKYACLKPITAQLVYQSALKLLSSSDLTSDFHKIEVQSSLMDHLSTLDLKEYSNEKLLYLAKSIEDTFSQA